jgi:predicted ATP-binding protein involved in virulence
MYIESIYAENFKALDNVKIETDGKSLLIFGVNGVGKSSILSVVNFLFWSWVNRLNPSQGIAYRTLSDECVRYGSSQLELRADVKLDDKTFHLKRNYLKSRYKSKGVSKGDKKNYDAFVNYIVDEYLEKDKDIPIFVNYGTNRSVLDIPLKIRKKHEFSTLASIERSDELDFRTFFEWYRNQEDIENEKKTELDNLSYRDKSLECVRHAIVTMLGNEYSNLRVSRSPLCMKVRKDNMDLRVDQLSDGEKCTIALFGDLARRIALANPNKDNPLEGEGIALIDEIDLHMHPSWQRRVLRVLKEVFPNIQFIITTHSPQILGEADSSYKVIGLYTESDNSVCVSEEYVYGKDSNEVLKTKMDTSVRSETVQTMFDEFYSMLDSGDFRHAENKLNDINELVADNDPEVASCWVRLEMEQI